METRRDDRQKNDRPSLEASIAYCTFTQKPGPLLGSPPGLTVSLYTNLISHKARPSPVATCIPVHRTFGHSPSSSPLFATLSSLCALQLRSVTRPAINRLGPRYLSHSGTIDRQLGYSPVARHTSNRKPPKPFSLSFATGPRNFVNYRMHVFTLQFCFSLPRVKLLPLASVYCSSFLRCVVVSMVRIVGFISKIHFLS